MLRALVILTTLSLTLLACSGTDSSAGGDAGTAGDGATQPGGDDGGGGGPCTVGARSCGGTESERTCEDVGGTPTWVETPCDAYNYCIDDRCVPACVDECGLGDTQGTGASAQTCRLYSADTGGFVSPGSGTHDLARRHVAWTRANQLANGYIADAVFSDAAHTTPIAYVGTVDAAEWTGMYLAAESLRLMETGAPDAERNVNAIITRVHQLFDITETPGYMARVWAPLDGSSLLSDMYDSADPSHFATTYDGGPAFYHAWTSRDMYAGMFMGIGLAYDATRSDTHRALLRDVVVTLARELVKERTDVPVRVRYNLFGSWQETDLTYTMRHVILVPKEMVDGRVYIQIGSDANPSDYNASELKGAREFFPDFQAVLSQTPGLGSLIPAIPRPSSAMMMANFLALALHVTDGVTGFEADRASIKAHYDANRSAWLDIMKQYEYFNDSECSKQYFGMTIAYHPIYGLLRLDGDAAFKTAVAKDVLAAKMRPFVDGHHNAYFDYIAASQGPAGLVSSATLATTGTQLAGFVAPPKSSYAVNNTGKYPANPDCPGQSSVPIDIADRVPQDFMFQHHPFRLINEFVNERHVFPTVDYLVAYWLGRHHGYLEDDAPNTCTRWTAN